MALFDMYERQLLDTAEGLADTLAWLREQEIVCDVVAELKRTLGAVGADQVSSFLQARGLLKYFDYFYSPQGKLGLKDSTVDTGCKGKDKASGTLYDYLVIDLAKRGFKVDECSMIGDKITTDIEQPCKRGFHTIQFTGVVDYGDSEFAEYKVKSFPEIKQFITRKR